MNIESVTGEGNLPVVGAVAREDMGTACVHAHAQVRYDDIHKT
eukprot:CAMPEP_0174727130 /NCGR_PEP_ID=MMETSP1094-20130205/49154_1 /TAXON_ID=156173 /ORGANISM="Chrysochromulina brevifilum, Strain UTEX LB 985" /LENGTH=42 /DNA_ID= /DNA_START= /DNA_END= /DNA_ORIENTATION=